MGSGCRKQFIRETMVPSEASKARDELWTVYAWWGSILIVQMMALIWFTGRLRVHKKVIHSEEDRRYVEGPNVIICSSGGGHPDIDRIRAAHRNDLELILLFFIITFIWLGTLPSLFAGKIVVRFFSVSKILHTLMYTNVIGAGDLGEMILFGVCYGILGFMCVSCIIHYSN